MTKPKTFGGYDNAVTEACERVLVTLLRGLGPWKDSAFLVGGLTPRYLVRARPPEVPAHAGTGDVDVVVDLAILADTEAYRTLEENLRMMGFDRAENDEGRKQSWRWKTTLETGTTMILEFLADDPERAGGKVQELPAKGKVSALNIPHASMVFDFYESAEITAELLGDNGVITETVRYADVVSFTCLKAFAFESRFEPKDAHDLVYCLDHVEGGTEATIAAFSKALETGHRETEPPRDRRGPFGLSYAVDVLPIFSSSLSESFPALRSLGARSWDMKKSKYTDEQIAFALKQAETGTPVAEVIRRMGISEQTFYRWKKVYGGLGAGELRRLKLLEEENRKLKQLVANLSLDKHILQDFLPKKL